MSSNSGHLHAGEAEDQVSNPRGKVEDFHGHKLNAEWLEVLR